MHFLFDVQVKAPWIKNFVYVDYDTYIIPGIDSVTLGGVRNFDSWNSEIDIYDSQAIWNRCISVIPSLKNAEVKEISTFLRKTYNKNFEFLIIYFSYKKTIISDN